MNREDLDYRAAADEANGKVRSTWICPRCGLEVSGVASSSDPEKAEQRLRNNKRLHLSGTRCARRAYAKKRNAT